MSSFEYWLTNFAAREPGHGFVVTVVAGRDPADTLVCVDAAVGVPHPPWNSESEPRVWAVDLQSSSAHLDGIPLSLLIEFGTIEGSDADVLTRLSKNGAAASLSWNASDLRLATFAECGRLIAQLEPPEILRGDFDWPSVGSGSDAVFSEFALASTTLIGELDVDLSRLETTRTFELAPTRTSLPVSLDELRNLQYPSPAVVAAVSAATLEDKRRLAKWAVQCALQTAELGESADQSVLVQSIGARTDIAKQWCTGLQADLDRESAQINSTIGDRLRSESWGSKNWALQAVRYSMSGNADLAALGSVYSASRQVRGRARDDVLRKALSVLRSSLND